jgi:hypothetical protein
MKILSLAAVLILLLLGGAFAYVAFTDVPIVQQEVAKEIPAERVNAQ